MNIISEKLSVDFMKLSRVTIYISFILICISMYLIVFKGINASIDFKGGTIINLSVDKDNLDLSLLRENLTKALNQSIEVVEVESKSNYSELILKMEYLDNENVLHTSLNTMFNNQYKIIKIESIGPKIGDELKVNARNAIIASL